VTDTTFRPVDKVGVSVETRNALSLRCPRCHRTFIDVNVYRPTRAACSACGFLIVEENGIVRTLTPARKARFEQFLRDYTLVRQNEGWGSLMPEYYLALPFKDLTHRHDWIWRIRAQTWRYIEKHILLHNSGTRSGMRVLDIGAGNGWLSYRLAQHGYEPVAVDLLDDDSDGLGAARHYFPHLPQHFPRFQADMDHLPFDSAQFDVAIFNASFHYSSDYEKTLGETIRCVRPSGLVIIADSPFYKRDESGREMLQERQKSFSGKFGIDSRAIRNREYLTPGTLSELSSRLGICWNVGRPWYGIGWALRPVKARLLRHREPSKFYLWWFRV
jgi:SAM-dependent methyltransferase